MKVETVYEISFQTNGDSRGYLTAIEQNIDIPFEIKRIFYMHHVTLDRGGHAHIDTDQVIIPIAGSFKVKVFDGVNEDVYILNDCTKGIYTPRLTFCELFDFTEDAVCLVLANTYYDIKMSLRTKDDYLSYLKRTK
ncbi:MAG: TDP-4-oxo-6-deoxy-alpha-D-glucose-3,4-oxoisomerase [Bacteroidetes bacterium ADurb.Bin234]|jgi:dTDP-4-dehydrorhamnose 3,5-epimerase-like enzyme|nr:MAG: TDP-4-oxo-6-deoxy-alpha-D-glucose-3,4-oxoisomerase [Bacteroidetes bacterium ADurb.Bin234]